MNIKINTLWNLLGSGAPMLLGLLTIPYLIDNIGVEAFGILTLVWALIGYFSLFDLGLGRTLTQQIALYKSKYSTSEIIKIVKNGLTITLISGIIGCISLALLSFNLAHYWLKVTENLKDDTFKCLIISAIAIPFVTITSGLKGILEGYEDFKIVNLLKLIFGIANFGFPVISVFLFGNNLFWIVLSLVITRLVIFLLHYFMVYLRIGNFLSGEFGKSKDFKEMFFFGTWITVSNIVSQLMVTSDRFIISFVLGANIVAFYTIPFEILIRVLILPAALTTALFPRLSNLYNIDQSDAKALYLKSFKIVSQSMFVICLIIAVISDFGLSIWISKNFASQSAKIAMILSIGIFFNGIAQIPHSALQSIGKVKITAIIHVLELLFYVPVLYISLKHFGLIAAPIIWSTRAAVDFILLNTYFRKFS